MIIDITNENFENEVVRSEIPVLVDFWAEWCGPCRMIAPIVHEIAEQRSDIKVCKVNVDNNPQLCNQFGIDSIP
ncbi:MAG: thiol reductase thioredoxin, partial [Ruminococcaceae bacterium]|nr:thiol reductase thioredoxin [Oscillospiraceae bacterium]